MSGEAPESGPSHPPTGPPAAVQVPNASIHVFISYASQDDAVADTVVGALERAGLRCWIAPRDVVPGALYANEIVRAINESKVVVLILSEQACSIQHGDALAHVTTPQRAACTTCHGRDLRGVGAVPRIAGQMPSYLARQLWDIKSGSRDGDSVAPCARWYGTCSRASLSRLPRISLH